MSLIHDVIQIRSQDFVPLWNRLRQHFFRILRHSPAQIESQTAISVRDFQRRPHPFPEFVGAFAAEIKIGERPARLELTIHARRIQQPCFGPRKISACFGRQAPGVCAAPKTADSHERRAPAARLNFRHRNPSAERGTTDSWRDPAESPARAPPTPAFACEMPRPPAPVEWSRQQRSPT